MRTQGALVFKVLSEIILVTKVGWKIHAVFVCFFLPPCGKKNITAIALIYNFARLIL